MKTDTKNLKNKPYFVKNNVEFKEYIIHKIVYNAGIINVPRIYEYDEINKILIMEKINNMCISDLYGEDASNVPNEIMQRIQEEVKKLFCYGVSYPDITGYNFILYKNKIYTIDFGHASFFITDGVINEKIVLDPFIKRFINGLCKWNPEYK
jgi:tRNA A-37 threonylcarbamoyl transferase component Bud32